MTGSVAVHIIPQPLSGINTPIMISDRLYCRIQGEREREWFVALAKLVKKLRQVTYLSSAEKTITPGLTPVQIRITPMIYEGEVAILICEKGE